MRRLMSGLLASKVWSVPKIVVHKDNEEKHMYFEEETFEQVDFSKNRYKKGEYEDCVFVNAPPLNQRFRRGFYQVEA